MSLPQQSDRLSLDEALAAMRRLGVASEEYVNGYEAGFIGRTSEVMLRCGPSERDVAYRRGQWAGKKARERGAHEVSA